MPQCNGNVGENLDKIIEQMKLNYNNNNVLLNNKCSLSNMVSIDG